MQSRVVPFKYESDTAKRGWWTDSFNCVYGYPRPERIHYYAYLAEIAGIKFEDFSCRQDFDKALKHIRKKNQNLNKIMNSRCRIGGDVEMFFRLDEISSIRRRRGQKIGRFQICGTGITRFDALMLLQRITGNLLPDSLNHMIIIEFLGLKNPIGCTHCQKKKRPLDTIISHQFKSCPYLKLRCAHCVYHTPNDSDHTIEKCYDLFWARKNKKGLQCNSFPSIDPNLECNYFDQWGPEYGYTLGSDSDSDSDSDLDSGPACDWY